MVDKRRMFEQILVAVVAVAVTTAAAGIWNWASKGELVRIMGGVTEEELVKISGLISDANEANLTADNIAANPVIADIRERIEENRNAAESLIGRTELGAHDIYHEAIKVEGEGPWGSWHEPTYCPARHYVCGLEQKLEGPQGGGSGDDTALNGVAMRCCKLSLIISD